MPQLDPVITAAYVVTLSAPVAVYASVRLARAADHDHHRIVQAVLVALCWLSVLGIELRIRFAGGSGAFIEHTPVAFAGWAQRLLAVHIAVALATYGLWTGLAVASWRRFGTRLPGRFSPRHRALGTAVFGGLCFTAASATGIFVLAFVL